MMGFSWVINLFIIGFFLNFRSVSQNIRERQRQKQREREYQQNSGCLPSYYQNKKSRQKLYSQVFHLQRCDFKQSEAFKSKADPDTFPSGMLNVRGFCQCNLTFFFTIGHPVNGVLNINFQYHYLDNGSLNIAISSDGSSMPHQFSSWLPRQKVLISKLAIL